jgi:BirA family biotin operon repressor/biotin-[acetyl-CoA-carboxylase] ligase
MNEKTRWEESIDIDGRVVVLEEVASTQDAAVEHDLVAGDVCAALTQTAGRGRRGSFWDASGGVAVTVVLESLSRHFSIAVAATLAAQLNNLVPTCKIGISWPNDLCIQGRKLAGILIEQREGLCLVGVGVNVLAVPTDQHATYLNAFGTTNRAIVVQCVVASVFAACHLEAVAAISAWRDRDFLLGTNQHVRSAGKVVEGTVVDIDPCNNLQLETKEGVLTLPAETSTIVTPYPTTI